MCVTSFCLTHTNTPPGKTGLNNNRNMSEGVNGGGVMKWNWYETVKKNVKKKK